MVAAVVSGPGLAACVTLPADEVQDEGYPLIVVAGPTASGKTALALRLAEELGGEIVSCDSVAVYRLMEIGTAKPTAEERERVPHHGLDLYWPDEACTAGDYARQARAAIAAIRGRGAIPVVTGGTGLYLRALLDGLAPAPQRDEALRERLRARVARRGSPWLHRVLQRMDSRAAALIHANDAPKLMRSIEVTLAARAPQTRQWEAGREALQGYRVLQFALGPARERLYARINARAAAMFARGLVEETAMLRERFGDQCRTLGALGYAQAMAELRGECSRAQAVAAAQQGHRNYAKRQMTWFRREQPMRWLAGFGDESDVQEEALALVRAEFAREPVGGGEGWSMTGVRIDKWMWAARFFKTRALASKACEMGRMQSNDLPAKASREVRLGDVLRVTNEAGEFVVEVLALSEVRGPAAVARALYRETEASREARARVAAERKAMFAADALPMGKPSKRDRRVINRFRGR